MVAKKNGIESPDSWIPAAAVLCDMGKAFNPFCLIFKMVIFSCHPHLKQKGEVLGEELLY